MRKLSVTAAKSRLLSLMRVARHKARSALTSPTARNVTEPLGENGLPGDPDSLLYFGDSPATIYQAAGWLGVLSDERVQRKFGVLTRDLGTMEALAELTELPVYYIEDFVQIDAAIDRSNVETICYVNHNVSNYQMLRLSGVAHIHIGHGESEKTYMTANQVRAYDEVFVAGDASALRLSNNVRGLDPSKVTVIGRPQADVFEQLDLASKPTLLYAPTWEGDSEDSNYSSIETLGLAIVEAAEEAGFSLIFRPHPLAGFRRVELAQTVDSLSRRVTEVGGVIDTETPVESLLGAAHALVADVSAVAVDFLRLDRPIFVTRVTTTESGGPILAASVRIEETSISRLAEILRDGVQNDTNGDRRAAALKSHLGAFAAGESIDAFGTALNRAVQTHLRWLAEAHGTLPQNAAPGE